LTQGYGLFPEDGLTAQLQDWLEARDAGVSILNAGVSGDTTTGGAQRVEWTLTPDVDAMIVTLGGNDMLRGIAPELTRSNLDKILKIAAQKDIPVLLVGLAAARNFGSGYKSEFDAIYPELAAKHGVLFVRNLFEPLLSLGAWSDVLQTHMQRDGIHPNADGVALIVEALGPKVLELAHATSP
jgi:acyl-CoA thioesterase-1